MSVELPGVEIPPALKFGTFANAFRVMRDAGEVMLDFLNYSEIERSAVVVARVRVTEGFLPQIRDHLGAAMIELAAARQAAEAGPAPAPETVIVMPDGGDVN